MPAIVAAHQDERAVAHQRAIAANTFDLSYNAEPTLKLFHRSTAFLRGIRGPLGSGKSSACVVEIVRRAYEQAPDKRGHRRTRWAAIRNTYGELLSTTIKTWQRWVPNEVAPLKQSVPITAHMVIALPDGTIVDCEVIFVSCDRPADVAKLKSMDLTGLWLNEASELDKSVLDMATGRHSRYPEKDEAPYTWSGVIMDTNSMDDLHWWYTLSDQRNPEAMREMKDVMDGLMRELGLPPRDLIEFFDQPPAMLEVKHNDEGGISYVPNPAAENVGHQPLGAGYWYQQIAGKSKDWIDVFILNKYGRVVDGKPVYPEYDENWHGKRRIVKPIEGLPIILPLDYGLTPACVPIQFHPLGGLMVLGEVCSENGPRNPMLQRNLDATEVTGMGAKQFLRDALKPFLINRYGSSWEYRVTGDPSGSQRAQPDSTLTCESEVIAAGFEYTPGKTNDFVARRDAVAYYLTKAFPGGEPAMLIDESCHIIKAGFAGRYHYRRVQVAGDARYQDKPYKNLWSHPHDALQYGAMEGHDVQLKPVEADSTPAWMRKLAGMDSRPYRFRGGLPR